MPGAVYIGDTAAKIISEEIFFDPDRGDRALILWEGPEVDMRAVGAIYRALGAEAHAAPYRGPVWRCRITGSPTLINGGTEPAVERWTRRIEVAQVDIRNNPLLIAAAGSDKTLARWIAECTAILKSENPESAGFPTSETTPEKQAKKEALLGQMARGVEAYEVARLVLVRRIVLGLNELHHAAPVEVPVFYSTTAFIAAFQVPLALAGKLPGSNLPTPPADTQWGWRERDDDEDITPMYNKVEQVRTWVFGAHSTLLYGYVQ